MDGFTLGHLKGVSRTYALVIPMLPAPLDVAVGLSYLLMRIVDTMEDAAELGDQDRHDLLREFRRHINENGVDLPARLSRPLGANAAEVSLLAQVPEVLRRLDELPPDYRSPAIECASTMIDGVLSMLTRSQERQRPYPAIRDSSEMRQYCYFVAGVVGEMLCAMMAHYLRAPALLKLRPVAVELGIGLQLVNILKDAWQDSTQGRRYLPTTGNGQVSPAEIYRAVLNEARQSLEKGAEFVLALPATAWQLRSFCGLPIAWGAMTLAKAERNAAKAKIGRAAIRESIESFTRLAKDDHALRDWLMGLLRAPHTV